MGDDGVDFLHADGTRSGFAVADLPVRTLDDLPMPVGEGKALTALIAGAPGSNS
jgi:hypothetical protein